MKKYITIATLLAAGSALANADVVDAAQIHAEFTTIPVQAGNCWSGDYVFEFKLDYDPNWDLVDNDHDMLVLGFYRGSAINDDYGYNAIVLNKLENDEMTLTIGRGRAYDTVDEATGIDDETYFVFQDKVTFTKKIEADIIYTLSVSGGDQEMTPTLTWDGGSETLASYKGNMNGNAALTYAAIPVPEPSTFGLLAGLGALALVGTRRRNRR